MRTALFVLALPFSLVLASAAHAAPGPASFQAAESLLVASSSPGNAYAFGASVVLTAPVLGDLSAAGGSVVVAAPVSGDNLLFGGSVSARAPVSGDLRAVGGSVMVLQPVAGDILGIGWSVRTDARAGGSVFVAAWNAAVEGGATGPVTVYANNVSLKGEFGADVRIFSSGRVMIAPDTRIAGSLSYTAPEPGDIPESVVVEGGITYTSASYLPNPGTSRILALISIGLFLLVRILGALLLAGLLTGLFPRLAEAVVDWAQKDRARDILLTMLLGFGMLVATPVLLIVLTLTFVGIGLALLLFALYGLLLILSVMYAGILLGGLIARRYAKRERILWHDGMLGMLVLSIIAFVPFIGLFAIFLLMTFTAGVLALLFFRTAFPR